MKNLLLLFSLAMLASVGHSQWTNFANGNTNGTVIDFEWHNGELYAGGLFTQINGDNASSVAKWDGNNWQSVGGGLPDGVHHLEVIDSVLYAVRYEMQVDSNWVYYLENGSWKKLGSGFYLTGASAGQFYTPSMYDVRKYNGDIIACGEFDQGQGGPLNCIASWNGSSWSALGSGLSDPFFGQVVYPHQMLVHNGLLYVCGNFEKAGGVQVNGVAVWDGTSWAGLGAGFNSTVYGLGVYNNEIYAGGDFTMSGSTPLGTIAKWDGSNWVSPGFGFDHTSPNSYLFVHTIEEVNNQLYVMGGFDRVVPDGQPALAAGSVIAFDGQGIDLMGGGANNDVESITEYMGQILVGGFFVTVGNGVSASRLALYDRLATGVEALPLMENNIAIAPNPVGDFLEVNGVGEEATFELVNLEGAVLMSGEYAGPINVEMLPKGMYFLQVNSVDDRRVFKVLKR